MGRLIRPGLSLAVCIGGWGGINLRLGERWIGVCLGFVSIMFYTLDFEAMLGELVRRAWPDDEAEGSAK